MKRDWHAYHIFYHRFDKQDSLLLDCIAPLVAEVQEKTYARIGFLSAIGKVDLISVFVFWIRILWLKR